MSQRSNISRDAAPACQQITAEVVRALGYLLSASLLRFSMYAKLGGNPGVDPEPLDLGMLRDPSRGTEKCGRGECLEYPA